MQVITGAKTFTRVFESNQYNHTSMDSKALIQYKDTILPV